MPREKTEKRNKALSLSLSSAAITSSTQLSRNSNRSKMLQKKTRADLDGQDIHSMFMKIKKADQPTPIKKDLLLLPMPVEKERNQLVKKKKKESISLVNSLADSLVNVL